MEKKQINPRTIISDFTKIAIDNGWTVIKTNTFTDVVLIKAEKNGKEKIFVIGKHQGILEEHKLMLK
jgi:hypothetical protein